MREHNGRNRDRCDHPWWGSVCGVRVSLSKWTDREIHSKAEAGAALDDLRLAVRARTFDPNGLNPIEVGPVKQEETALLEAAPAHLQAMLIAALDTGMRQGEMLAVRFVDVDPTRGLITLRGQPSLRRQDALCERPAGARLQIVLEVEGVSLPPELDGYDDCPRPP